MRWPVWCLTRRTLHLGDPEPDGDALEGNLPRREDPGSGEGPVGPPEPRYHLTLGSVTAEIRK